MPERAEEAKDDRVNGGGERAVRANDAIDDIESRDERS